MAREELGLQSLISDPDFDEKLDFFINVVCHRDVERALQETRANRYDSKRAFVCKAVEGYKKRHPDWEKDMDED